MSYNFADQGKARFFSDIAVKPNAEEFPITNTTDLLKCLEAGISGSNISGEVDLLDDGKISIACMSDIEAIIVDNDNVMDRVLAALKACDEGGDIPQMFVSPLPR